MTEKVNENLINTLLDLKTSLNLGKAYESLSIAREAFKEAEESLRHIPSRDNMTVSMCNDIASYVSTQIETLRAYCTCIMELTNKLEETAILTNKEHKDESE